VVKVRLSAADYETVTARAVTVGASVPAYLVMAGMWTPAESSALTGDRC
jgi:hypothetical protein